LASAERVMSLPFHPYLGEVQLQRVATALLDAVSV
jgi:dTDP-4-amino-4,6-dideoxygalactose transaminase